MKLPIEMKITDKYRNVIQGLVARHVAYEVNGKPHTCETCGKTGRVEVHHIDKNRDNNDISNLKILCRYCHNRCHSMIKPVGKIDILDIVKFYYLPNNTLKSTGEHFEVSATYIMGRLEDAGYSRKKAGGLRSSNTRKPITPVAELSALSAMSKEQRLKKGKSFILKRIAATQAYREKWGITD